MHLQSKGFGSALDAHFHAIQQPLWQGRALAEDGWQFRQIGPDELPKSADTVVYVNASDPAVDAKALPQRLAGFVGEIIIDSDLVKSAVMAWLDLSPCPPAKARCTKAGATAVPAASRTPSA
jgi:hypothetical protein